MCSAKYTQLVDNRILQSLASGGRRLEELLPYLRGAFPLVVKSSLDGLVSVGKVELIDGVFYLPSNEKQICRQIVRSNSNGLGHLWDTLPEPHPLNFEWYWGYNTLDLIYQLQDWSNLRIAFLGCPKLFTYFALQSSSKRLLLVDRNKWLLDVLRPNLPDFAEVLIHDLFSPIPHHLYGQFDVVFADPPWYLEHSKVWLTRSLELTAQGLIYFSLFPELIRSNAKIDRENFLAFLHSCSLDQFEVLHDALGYSTPIFEQTTLKALNLNLDFEHPWRYGDLVSVHRLQKAVVPKITQNFDPDYGSTWETYLFGRQVIRVRVPRTTDASNLSLGSIYDDGSFIYRSVSLRDCLRKNIGLWTSRNKVFSVRGATILCKLLTLLEHGYERLSIANKLCTENGTPEEDIWNAITLINREIFDELGGVSSGADNNTEV